MTWNELVNGPLTPAQYPGAIATLPQVPPATAAFIATVVYPLAAYPSPSVALGAVGTDAILACNPRTAARLSTSGRCAMTRWRMRLGSVPR